MKIHQSTSHLTGLEQKELGLITKALIAHLKPEVIFCYGSRVTQQTSRSCFVKKRRIEDPAAMYDLVIIVNDNDPCSEERLLAKAEAWAGDYCHTSIIVHKASFVNTEIEKGNFFFTWLYRSALILYDKNSSWLAYKDRLSKHDCFKLNKELEGKLKCLLKITISYREMAIEKKKNYPATLTLYHLALVHSCKAAILACLGYEINNANAERLISLTLNFTPLILEIFPRNTDEENELFLLVSKISSPELEDNKDSLFAERILNILEQKIGLLIKVVTYLIKDRMAFIKSSS